MKRRFDFTYSIAWNLFLLTAGSVLFSFGAKAIAVQHEFVTGGLFGTALLLHYVTGGHAWTSPGLLYFLANIPLMILGWLKVSRRFLLYSIYAMAVVSLSYEVITINAGIHNQLYAAVAAGVICGAGGGIILRSLGSAGGLDIVAVILNQRYNLGIGRFYFLYNLMLFSMCLFTLPVDLVIASLIMVFITSVVVDSTLSLFSQRKVVLIISDHNEQIAQRVTDKLKLGATFLQGRGAYSGREKNVLMTVINNIQLRRLEELVFTQDPGAMFIVENTFNVLGASFSRRKLY